MIGCSFSVPTDAKVVRKLGLFAHHHCERSTGQPSAMNSLFHLIAQQVGHLGIGGLCIQHHNKGMRDQHVVGIDPKVNLRRSTFLDETEALAIRFPTDSVTSCAPGERHRMGQWQRSNQPAIDPQNAERVPVQSTLR